MAPRASWKGTLTFGMVALPVGIAPAASRNDIAFKTLAPSGAPVKQSYSDSVTGEVVEYADRRKGFEYQKGSYIQVSDDELHRFAARAGKDIRIVGFVPMADVPHGVIERTYLMFADGGSNRDHAHQRRAALAAPYALIAQALAESGRAGLGRLVMSTKEYPVLIRSDGTNLYLDLLFWNDEVRVHDDPPCEVAPEQVGMAVALIEAMAMDFTLPTNDARAAMVDYLLAKVAGSDEASANPPDATPTPVVNLMDALRESLAAL